MKTVDACNRHPCGAIRITLPWLIEKMGLPITNNHNSNDVIMNTIADNNSKEGIKNEIDGTNSATNTIDPKINENIDMSMNTNTTEAVAIEVSIASFSVPKRRFPIKRSLTLEGNDTTIGTTSTTNIIYIHSDI